MKKLLAILALLALLAGCKKEAPVCPEPESPAWPGYLEIGSRDFRPVKVGVWCDTLIVMDPSTVIIINSKP